jgi:hypothetical protein
MTFWCIGDHRGPELTNARAREIEASLFPIYQDDYINATFIPIEEWTFLVGLHIPYTFLVHSRGD